MVLLFYTTYISVDLAQHGLFHAKVGKDGINTITILLSANSWSILQYLRPALSDNWS